MSRYASVLKRLPGERHVWLITGVAGFIGSNLLYTLLKLDQKVVGLDNFSTGHKSNLEELESIVSPTQWQRFRFVEGDISNYKDCVECCQGVDYVLHQAALGSVPRSIADPVRTNESNVTGFLNMLSAAREAQVQRFVYAASSSTYGDHAELPKVEGVIGSPLSPYAVTKYVNELYADVFSRCYGFRSIGLRYFNIFGPRQDPEGAYAAVIPKWISGLLNDEEIFINGDGETSRDFCFIENAIQANILSAMTPDEAAVGEVYNVAVGERTTLNRLFEMIRDLLAETFPEISGRTPVYREFRAGDVRHSLADISKARELLGYEPSHTVVAGLREAMDWYVADLKGTGNNPDGPSAL